MRFSHNSMSCSNTGLAQIATAAEEADEERLGAVSSSASPASQIGTSALSPYRDNLVSVAAPSVRC